jgi:hypothetical protein
MIGLKISDHPPYSVVSAEDLVDVNHVRQGAPGYTNPEVRPSDRILRIDDVSAASVPVETLKRMLGGELNSPVCITLARAHGQGKHFSVTVLRHRAGSAGRETDGWEEDTPSAPCKTLRLQLQQAQRDISNEASVLSPRPATNSLDAQGRGVGLKTVILLDTAGNSLADPVFRRWHGGTQNSIARSVNTLFRAETCGGNLKKDNPLGLTL